jgi:hypothetical protein
MLHSVSITFFNFPCIRNRSCCAQNASYVHPNGKAVKETIVLENRWHQKVLEWEEGNYSSLWLGTLSDPDGTSKLHRHGGLSLANGRLLAMDEMDAAEAALVGVRRRWGVGRCVGWPLMCGEGDGETNVQQGSARRRRRAGSGVG